jgi:hydroxymethylpyrimidine pyrophosphatase-like HAD family hydrolase
MIIAVDFDGTIVEDRYPEIGREKPFAVQTLKMLVEQRHRIILWTVREGQYLEEAVAWCRERGLEFYAVNKDYPEEQKEHKTFSRKIKADLFIDDRNLGGLPDWGVIYKIITEKKSYYSIIREELCVHQEPPKRPRFKLFR